jgi:hypothetical protein
MPFLYNCVDTSLAESTEMAISQGLRKQIVALHKEGATGYIVSKQLMLSQTSVGRIMELYKESRRILRADFCMTDNHV